MPQVRFRFWQRWLVAVCGGTVLFGLAMAFGSGTVLFAPYLRHLDAVFWGGTPPEGASALYRWLLAVLGSSIAGWGVALTCVARGPFARREPWAHRCFAASITLWVLVDTGFSWHAGVGQEVAFNVVAALLIGIPLLATAPAFRSHGDAPAR
jgi:hypothetical protein